MKRILLILAGVLFAGVLHAQQYQAESFALTNFLAANATNTTIGATNTVSGGHTVGVAIKSVNKFEDIAIQVSSILGGAGTANGKFAFARSMDGTTYETTPSNIVLVLTGTGAGRAVATSNINVGANAYIKCVSIANANDQEMTNIVIQYATKPQRFGK